MRLLDSDRLVAFLHHGEDTARSLLVQAVYAGLETRITRGEFDAHDIAYDLDSPADSKTAPGSAPTLPRGLDNHLHNRRPS